MTLTEVFLLSHAVYVPILFFRHFNFNSGCYFNSGQRTRLNEAEMKEANILNCLAKLALVDNLRVNFTFVQSLLSYNIILQNYCKALFNSHLLSGQIAWVLYARHTNVNTADFSEVGNPVTLFVHVFLLVLRPPSTLRTHISLLRPCFKVASDMAKTEKICSKLHIMIR